MPKSFKCVLFAFRLQEWICFCLSVHVIKLSSATHEKKPASHSLSKYCLLRALFWMSRQIIDRCDSDVTPSSAVDHTGQIHVAVFPKHEAVTSYVTAWDCPSVCEIHIDTPFCTEMSPSVTALQSHHSQIHLVKFL